MCTNNLASEKSPYLLQHAHNPVNWYAWGETAFVKAHTERKPIFLSVGYSTCHWCHVMERESFENAAIAEILNDYFVSIKVDREERPDVDRVYMTFVQATAGGGGWPMSVWLTPDLKPFHGGTYYTAAQFTQLLTKIADLWKLDRDKITTAADSVVHQLQDMTTTKEAPGTDVDLEMVDAGYRQIAATYDPVCGGFGGAPKFPLAATNNFMLRYYSCSGIDAALEMALFTLRKMAAGGIHDHVGGGFHRYSVDQQWHVPHFEKMLYDQAQLAVSYLEAYQLTRDPLLATVARGILEYVLTRMTGPDGQFYCAEDADSALPHRPSARAEGAFYVWAQDEITDALPEGQAGIFNFCYGIKKHGNVSHDPHNEFRDKNILIASHSIKEAAVNFALPEDKVQHLLADAMVRLKKTRSARPRPFLDDKTLTSWSSLMISAFAKGYQVLEDPRYLAAAQRATTFICSWLYDSANGRLSRRHRDGETAISGNLDDYAFFIQALLDLYECDFDSGHLARAINLQKKQDELFCDESGGYFTCSGEDTSIILNTKEGQDGAEPSANAISAMNLLRLAGITGEPGLRLKAGSTLHAFADQLQTMPGAMPQMLIALRVFLDAPEHVIVAGRKGAPDTIAMIRQVYSGFAPGRILLLADGGPGQRVLADRLDFVKDMKMIDGKATIFVCTNHTCKQPSNDPAAVATLLASGRRH